MAARIPRKKGQPAKSDKHSDLYTDEDPKGTIQGLQFKNKRAAALSSFNTNLDQFIDKVEEIVATATSS